MRPVLAITSQELKIQNHNKLQSFQLIQLYFLCADPPTGLLVPQVGNSGTHHFLQFIRQILQPSPTNVANVAKKGKGRRGHPAFPYRAENKKRMTEESIRNKQGIILIIYSLLIYCIVVYVLS